MVAQRRFGPLVAVLCAGLAVLLVRLFQVQVLEHEVWASEAAAMLRSSRTVAYHRGRILDRTGRVLVEDEDVYEVELSYRDFRRGHPLGQVALACSALEMRPVPFAEALARLDPWALEFVSLSPADLDRFAKGGSLRLASVEIPAVADARSDARASRASDLRFYVAALLGITDDERRSLRAAEKDPASASSYVDLLAQARAVSSESLLDQLGRRLAAVPGTLREIALLLAEDAALGPDPLAGFVERLESVRHDFEDSAADALFEEACGFEPGRVSAPSLERVFDMAWIARSLRWDGTRSREWVRSRREAFERGIVEGLVPRILAHVSLARAEDRAGRLLDEIADLYVPARDDRRMPGEPPRSWRELDEVCVLSEARTLFDLPRRPRLGTIEATALPFQDRDARSVAGDLGDPWLAVGMIFELARVDSVDPNASASAPAVAAAWRKIAATSAGFAGGAAREELGRLVLALERRLLDACDRAFEACLAAAATGDAVPGPLSISAERRERAAEMERFLLKDLSSRPVLLTARASYPLVHQIARFADACRGLEVREATRRVAVERDASGAPAARLLVGSVGSPSLRKLFAQREDDRRLSDLRDRILRSEEDEEEMKRIAGSLYRADERTGRSGLEAYFDPELRGRYGYVETQSLESRAEGGGEGILEAPVDGQDLGLTIDLDLQLAAQETLDHPVLPAADETERVWFQNPVGAIALITPEGEILAAASEPNRGGLPATPERDGERGVARERTLQRGPTSCPPGSVFKPFVAAWALDHLGLSPTQTFSCLPLPEGGCGYKDMHCHKNPHGPSDLARAIEVSCNAWFAQLGERYTPEQLLEMTEAFGFGRPTGVRHLGLEGRAGLGEDPFLYRVDALPGRLLVGAERMRFANGLGTIDATPMQVARATAALVTGRLPELRIARTIGGEPVPRASSELPISARSREIVCRALQGVVAEPGATAYGKGLDRATLGFSFAGKTGSADKRPMPGSTDRLESGQRKMIKQAWIAGWFPVEDPQAVLVVMLHDVSETSNHNVVYVASQFLRTEAVRRFVEEARCAAAKAGAAKSDQGGAR